jgi:hypothetical protein
MESIFDASFLLLHVGFGFGTDADDSHTTGELGESFLEFLLIVLAIGLIDLGADLGNALIDRFAVSTTFDDGRIVLVDNDLFGSSEVFEGDFFELDPEVFADEGTAGQDSDIPEHRFASVAEARGFDGAHIEGATELIDDQERKGFCIDIFGDDQQGLARGANLFEQWD